jgi:hypothetical protein
MGSNQQATRRLTVTDPTWNSWAAARLTCRPARVAQRCRAGPFTAKVSHAWGSLIGTRPAVRRQLANSWRGIDFQE